jgi:hypothetical protein
MPPTNGIVEGSLASPADIAQFNARKSWTLFGSFKLARRTSTAVLRVRKYFY